MNLSFILSGENNPLMLSYMARNPDSMFTRMYQTRYPNAGQNSSLAGSNNTGGTATSTGATSSGGLLDPAVQLLYGLSRGGGSNNLTGANNAGGAPTSTPSGAPTGFGGITRQTPMPVQTPANPVGGMFPSGGMSRQDTYPVDGSTIPSFAAGGMMSERGSAVRPGMPPSAGTGRTLPSARFKVDAQLPQSGNMMSSGGPALGAASPAPMDPAQIDQEAQRFVQQHTEEVQKIQEVIALAMQTGELTSDELNMAVQLAKTALARPESYPQVRQFAIQNGLGTEQDLPQELDQGLLYVLIVAGKSMQNGAPTGGKGNVMQGQGPSPTQNSIVPEYSDGGETGDKAHIAKLHPREYVIPEDAVLFYGTDKFAKMIEKARNPDGSQQQ